MKLIQNWGIFILLFFITLVLGYYLGLAISTTVDYKLQDIQLRIPKPTNNIIIKMKKNGHVFKQKNKRKLLRRVIKDKSLKLKQNKPNKQVNPNKQDKPNNKIDKVLVKDNLKQIEKFINYSDYKLKKKGKKRKRKNKTHTSLPNNVINQQTEYYSKFNRDPDLEQYANNYKKHRLNEKTDTNLIAYNHEDIETNYSEYDMNLNCDKKNKKKEEKNFLSNKKCKKYFPKNSLDFKNIKEIEKKSNDWDMLPTRDKLCPNFKCQRKYMNCTNDHKIIN